MRSAIARESGKVSPVRELQARLGQKKDRERAHMEAEGQSNCHRVWIVEELKQSLAYSLQRIPAA